MSAEQVIKEAIIEAFPDFRGVEVKIETHKSAGYWKIEVWYNGTVSIMHAPEYVISTNPQAVAAEIIEGLKEQHSDLYESEPESSQKTDIEELNDTLREVRDYLKAISITLGLIHESFEPKECPVCHGLGTRDLGNGKWEYCPACRGVGSMR